MEAHIEKKDIILLLLFTFYFLNILPSWAMEPDITITATRIEEKALYVPQSVSVVTGKEMQEHNFRTLPESLQDEAGILVQETNYGGGSPFIRGLTGKHTLILVDGVRFNNSTFRFGPNQYFNNIDPLIVDRIEVVRGPASVLYGSDAIGGVINVITRKREDFSQPHDIDGTLTARYGSVDDSKTGRVEVSGNLQDFGFIGGKSYKDFEDLHGGKNTGLQEHTGYQENDGDVKLQYRLSEAGAISAGYRRVHQMNVPRTDKFVYNNESYFFDPQIWNSFFVTLEWQNPDSIRNRVKTTISFNQQIEGIKRQKAGGSILATYRDSVDTLGISFQINRLLWGRHILTYGVDYFDDRVDSQRTDISLATGISTSRQGNFPDDAEYSQIGVFVQDDVDITARLSTIIGLRYSESRVSATLPLPYGRFEDNYNDITGSLGLFYNLSGNIHCIATIAQGFRAPNLDDTTVLEKITNEGIDVPSPGLSPETSINYEAGIKFEYTNSNGSVFVFYDDLTDLIERGPGTYPGTGDTYIDENGNGIEDIGEAVRQKFNTGKAYIKGIEAEGGYRFSQAWTLNGNVSWIYGEDTERYEPLSRIPPVIGKLGIKWKRPSSNYWAEYFVRFAGKQDRLSSRDLTDPRIPSDGTSGWSTHNLRGGMDFKKWGRMSAAIENIFDEDYRVHGSGINSAGFNIAVTYSVDI